MPGAGGPSPSLGQFVLDIQGNLLNIISSLTNRLILLEEKYAAIPTTSATVNNYSTYGDINNSAGNGLAVDMIATPDSLGSNVLRDLRVGTVVTVTLCGTLTVGSPGSDLSFSLLSNGSELLSIQLTIPEGTGGSIRATFTMSMRNSSVFVSAVVIYAGTTASAAGEVAFDLLSNNIIALPCLWSSSESGGMLISKSATITSDIYV